MVQISSLLGRAVCAVGLCLFLFLTTPGNAEVIVSGDVLPDTDPATWIPGTIAYIGKTGEGMLNILNGSLVNSDVGFIGRYSGSTGEVSVDGAGSTWTCGNLYVGREGNGTLTVADGGTVNARTLTAAGADLKGNGTINAAGVISDVDLTFDAAHMTQGVSSFGSGGTLYVTPNGNTDLGIGYRGAGSLNVSEGAQITCGTGYLGHSAGSSGEAVVTGAGSYWRIEYRLSVGESGTGSLTVADGGRVRSAGQYNPRTYLGRNAGAVGTVVVTGADSRLEHEFLYVGYDGAGSLSITHGGRASGASSLSPSYIGYGAGSSGTVLVSGSGSRWGNSSDTYVGYYGQGSLTVESGGLVSAETLYASLDDLKGDGTINVKGFVSDVDLTFDGSQGTSRTFAFGTGGTVNLSSYSYGFAGLGAGCHGAGSLSIAEGYDVASRDGCLGASPGSSGVATVTGEGSNWSIDELDVGRSGNGTLTIENGGRVSGDHTYIGRNAGSPGAVVVSGAGSEWESDSLYIGYEGSGSFTVEKGASAVGHSGRTHLALEAGSTGAVLVTGPGSNLSTVGLNIGYGGSGSLRVENGGTVHTILRVDGDEDSYPATLGYDEGSSGTATVTGAGSSWDAGQLRVGVSGHGSLTIADGGHVDSRPLYVLGMRETFVYPSGIGYYESTGTVTVSGPGSSWTNSGELTVGYYGDGTLNITNGGLVSVAGILTIDYHSDGDSYINMAGGGMLALMGRADSSLTEFLGLIEGTDDIRYWDESISDWAPISDAAYGVDYTLEYITDGELAGYTLLTVGSIPTIPGDYNTDGTVDLADYTVWADHYGQSGTNLPGDGNEDGTIDFMDYTVWSDHFGESLSEYPPFP